MYGRNNILNSPELQTEIPVQGGKTDTNRIKHHGESDDTRAGGAEMFFLFLLWKQDSRRGKEREDGKVFKL